MRVAYVSADPGIDVFGTKGASVHVQAIVRALLRRGATVDLITPRADGTSAPDLAGDPRVRLHRLPRVRATEIAAREVGLRGAEAETASILAGLDGVDLVYERYALWSHTAMAWARAASVPSVLEVNAPLPAEQAKHRGLVDVTGAYAMTRAAVTNAHAVIGVTDAVTAWARTHSERPERVITVANGVDTRAVTPRRIPVHDGGAAPFTLGFVGTLKAWHGVETLIEALALLTEGGARAEGAPSWRLLVVGDGPRAADLRTLADERGVGGLVEWSGAVPARAVPALLHRMDVACAPYPAMEDFYFSPLKVTEYLAAGLPVIASAVGSLPALLGEGAHGDLVTPGDPGAIARAARTLRADVVRRHALRDANRAAALSHDWDHVFEATLNHAASADGRIPTMQAAMQGVCDG